MRKTFTLTKPMSKELNRLSLLWDVSEAEAMRRLFCLGSFLANHLNKGKELYTKEDNELTRLIFPEVTASLIRSKECL